MEISNNLGVQGIQQASSVQRPVSASETAQPTEAQSTAPVDKLDLSSEALGVSSASMEPVGSDIRVDKVADIRRAIANGTYETAEKISAALDRFLAQQS